ncbi:TonB-dependent receptor [Ponticaulis profundi]|uniref:TonB-dependent receptor n=1 Tax=Ponticaulis profundi TaxID=2665222 RepID=A0ABW1S983_9PROT
MNKTRASFRSRALLLTSALTSLSAVLAMPAIAQTAEEEQRLDTIEVVGMREAMQAAIAQQRNSDTVESVLTRDDIGQFPDQNVAESVRRLSGINVLDDQGEGRFVSVRGLDPELNASSLNGVRVPSPESDSRAVALDVIASELISSVSVKKTLTPDMDADTIGASIEIETTKGFDREDPYFSATVEGSYNDLNSETSPKGAFDFVYPVTDNFGISGGLSYYKRKTSTDNMEMDGWENEDGIVFAEDVEYRDYDVERERVSGTLSFDWRPAEHTELYARAVVSQFDDFEQRGRLIFALDADSIVDASGDTVTFSDQEEEIEVVRDLKDRFESQKIESYQVGGETDLDTWKFEYKLAYSKAEEHEFDTQDQTEFVREFDDEGFGVVFDYSNIETTTFDVVSGGDLFNDPSQYEYDKVTLVDGLAEEEEWSGQFDIARDYDLQNGDEFEFKTGVKARLKTKSYSLNESPYEGAEYNLGDVAGSPSYGLFDIGFVPALGATRAANAAAFANGELELEELDADFESAAAFFEVDEDVLAAFVQGKYKTEKLTLVGGIRVEDTKTDMRGNYAELIEEGATYNGEVLDDDMVFVTPVEYSKDYTDVLPSLNLKFDATDKLVLRGGIFKSVVRPKMSRIAPNQLIEKNDDDEVEAEFGNPNLDPYRAWNFDASAEYYFDNGGVIQLGAFHKRIRDFLVDVEVEGPQTFAGYVFTGEDDVVAYSINGDTATVTGLEFNYQQPLTFLPGLLNGTLVGFNYTYTDAEGEIPNGDGGMRSIPLPASAKNTYNAMIGYDKGGLELRLTASYRDEYLDEAGGSAGEDRYIDEHLQIDASAKYRINDNFQVFADLVNLNDANYLAYQKGPDRSRLLQYEEYSYTAKFGLRYTY